MLTPAGITATDTLAPGMEDSTAHPRRGLRIVAGAVDGVVVLGLAVVLSLLVEPLASLADDSPSVLSALVLALAVLAVVAVPLALLVGLESRYGTSPGKALLGLRVRTEDGRSPGLRRSLRRTAYRASPVGLVGATWSLASGDARTWHDEWTGTVVQGRPGRAAAAPPGRRAAPTRATPVPASPVVEAVDVLEAFTAAGGGRPPTGPADEAQPAEPGSPVAPTVGERGPADGRDADAAPGRAPSAARPAAERPATERPATEATAAPAGAVRCRCARVASFEGDEAVAYAGGHLRVVRRRPEAGELVLVCPITRATWLAREPWAAEGGATTLVRQALGTAPASARPVTSPSPRS